MLSLILARHGPVRDGLLAVLEAMPDIDQIVQVEGAKPAWKFVHTHCPDIVVIYSTVLKVDLLGFIAKLKAACDCPILTIVGGDADRQTVLAHGADVAVIEGIPSAKLAAHLHAMVQLKSERN
jgi:DNA-binding NarL/FixJ family response regulator